MVSTNLAMLGALWVGLVDLADVPLEVAPSMARLRGSDSLAQIAVTVRTIDGKPVDYTASAKYATENPAVARVDRDGLIRPIGDGSTTITVESAGHRATIGVLVSDFANSRPVHFVGEVVPILSKHGCNAGGCHGKASGQNGFRLSLLGFDPKSDYESLVKEGRGRRVFPTSPGASLLLKKPTAQIPHGGGKKFAVGSPEYNTLARWIGQGMPFGTGKEPELLRLTVEPPQRTIPRSGRQQVRVVAHYDDGTTTDVTRLAQYQSNAADLAEVDSKGVIQALDGVGEAAIMARFGGLVGVARATIPSGVDVPKRDEPASRNFIDPLVFRKLRELGLAPSDTCSDAEFARRSSLDICGLLPTPAEVVGFENDADPEKRAKWVDRLIARPEYADLFAMKWSAILKNKRGLGDVSQPGTFAFHGWIRQSLAENKPYDRFVAEIVAARGGRQRQPARRLVSSGIDGRAAGRRHGSAFSRPPDPVCPLPPPPVREMEPGRLLWLRLALFPDRHQARRRPDLAPDLHPARGDGLQSLDRRGSQAQTPGGSRAGRPRSLSRPPDRTGWLAQAA